MAQRPLKDVDGRVHLAGRCLGKGQGLEARHEAGIDLERPFDRANGVGRSTGEMEHEAQYVVERGAVGRQFERASGFGDRLVMMAERAQRQRTVAQDLGASRVLLAGIDQGLVQHLDRCGVVAEAVEGIAQHVARPGLQRLQAFAALLDSLVDIGHEFDQLALGGGEAVEVHVYRRQRQARFDMGRRAAHRVAKSPRRLVEAALPARHQAEIIGQHRLVGILGQRLAPQGFGFAERAALRQADGKEVQNVGPLAVAGQGGPEQRLGTVEPPGAQILQAGLQIGIGLGLRRRRRSGREGHGALCRPASRPRLHEMPWSRMSICSRRRWAM